ncbi:MULTISPECIES: hypothetical protein [Pseudomonas]|uniref:DUF1266 domain-containing protein n=1 Tax=Pseudomonas wuhanensis TaxID=2954098 RepID=A0ABY9GLI4_9PSED|nr:MULTISPECIES: hypothetical protein [unclassified Pseudomonas]WLI10800.1 hypothetical protein PSH65_21865 [Pseudomonas sp. FP603]WLI16622.1 hypothetical protein PSH88_20495 [Pseudomonas sp. FP607]
MSHPFRREIQKLRALVFGYTLFFIAGYELNRDFAMWCDRWWRARHPHSSARSKPNTKWFDLLEGAWPRDPWRRELKEDFPALRGVEDNPLWTVLAWEDIPSDAADLFIQRVHMNGAPLHPFTEKGMEALCGCPDWTRLAYLVALLRTRDLRYLTHRLWLRKNFSCYVKLVCLTTPCCACSSELYRRLHELYLLGQLGEVDHWPMNLQAFNKALRRHELLWGSLERKNWLHEWDAFGVTMLWHVMADLQLIASRFDQGQNDCPRGLLQRVRTTLTKHSETVIKLID